MTAGSADSEQFLREKRASNLYYDKKYVFVEHKIDRTVAEIECL
jgi:hypothetical protein